MFKSFENGKLGVILPVINLQILASVLTAVTLLHEKLTLGVLAGACISFLGVLVATSNPKF